MARFLFRLLKVLPRRAFLPGSGPFPPSRNVFIPPPTPVIPATASQAPPAGRRDVGVDLVAVSRSWPKASGLPSAWRSWRVVGNSGCPGSARSRSRRLRSLRSRVGSRRARFTSRGDPIPAKPRGVEAAQLSAGLAGVGFSRPAAGARPCLRTSAPWRLSRPSSCRSHRPGPLARVRSGRRGLARLFGGHASPRARPGNGWPVAGCSWSVRKIRSVSSCR